MIGLPTGPVDRDHPARDLRSVTPRNAVFLPWPRPPDRCPYRHSPRRRGGAACAEAGHFSGNAPTTIGLTDGRIKIGLEPRELERPAERKNKPPKRDTGAVFAFKRDGGTTRNATLIFVALAGIKVRPDVIFSLPCFNLTFLQVFETGGYVVHLKRGAYMTLTGCVLLAWKVFTVPAKIVGSLSILSNTQADFPHQPRTSLQGSILDVERSVFWVHSNVSRSHTERL